LFFQQLRVPFFRNVFVINVLEYGHITSYFAAACQNSFFLFFVLYNGVGEKTGKKEYKKKIILTCRFNDIQR
jgi:hypothetical protein